MKTPILIFVVAIFIIGCKKKKATPDAVPTIELVSVSPMSVKQFKDSIIITLKYADNNGDLGDESADEFSLHIKDSRLPNPDWYHFKPLAPVGSNIKIEGQLRIKLNSLFILGNDSTEFSNLTIKVKDQAGNWSNEVNSEKITITK